MHGEARNPYKILVRNLKGRCHLGNLTHKWKGNIQVNVKELKGVRVWTKFN
jgi:hypothetical protein